MERPNSKGANNFVVGLFVSIAVLVGAGFVVFMGGSSSISGEIKFRSKFIDVRGLNIGAPVFLSGIQIGRVVDFEFPELSNPNEQQITAVLSVYKKHALRIKKDSEATISTQGMLGDKVIMISPGSPDSPPINPSELIASNVPREFLEVLSKGGNLMENLNQVAMNLEVLLKQINSDNRVGSILANLDKTSKALAITADNLNQPKSPLGAMISGGPDDQLGPTLKSLRRILEKIDKGEGTLGALVNDSSLHEDLRILLGGAQRSQTVRFLIRQAISSGEKKADGVNKK